LNGLKNREEFWNRTGLKNRAVFLLKGLGKIVTLQRFFSVPGIQRPENREVRETRTLYPQLYNGMSGDYERQLCFSF
jgi:hypothetical protein